jgi:hypothetical protein
MPHDELPPQSPHMRWVRAQSHLRHVVYAAATVMLTAWCYQIHLALGLTMTFLAKHILVAILARSLQLPIRNVHTSFRARDRAV